MFLDIRLPIGLLFSIVGALLALFGAITKSGIGGHTLGMNVNLWWGMVLLVFGAAMLAVSYFSRRR